jgi:uncharacterized protein (DUF779 family)
VSKSWASSKHVFIPWSPTSDICGAGDRPVSLEEIDMVEKVIATEAALELIDFLKQKHGELMFHQSGGCCDNSAANCYLPGELTIGAGDEYLGEIGGCPFYISKSQYEYWKHTQLIIDVIEGRGGTFSLEGPEGKAFHTRSRVFSDAEWSEILHEHKQ